MQRTPLSFVRFLPLPRFSPLQFFTAAVCLLAIGFAAHASEPCETTPARDTSKTFSVLKEIASYSATRAPEGFALPVGKYTLEAQDADYWYFRAPTPIGHRVTEGRKVVEHRVTGGIRIAKHGAGGLAGGYIQGEGSVKELITELTASEFAWMEGTFWTKNF